MPNFECAICGKSIINAMVCNNCKKKYNPSDAWVQALIGQEKDWRNTNRRDDMHGLKTLSDYPIQSEEGNTDGWEIIYTDQTIKLEPVMTLDEMEQIELLLETFEDYYRQKQAQTILDVMSKRAKLTPGEVNALGIYLRFDDKISSQQSALHLTDIEGKPVSAAAYRRRICDLRRKLNRVDPNWINNYFNRP